MADKARRQRHFSQRLASPGPNGDSLILFFLSLIFSEPCSKICNMSFKNTLGFFGGWGGGLVRGVHHRSVSGDLGIFPAYSGIPACTLTIISTLSSECKPRGKKTGSRHTSPPPLPLWQSRPATRRFLSTPRGPREALQQPGAPACVSRPRFTAFGAERARSV